MKSAAHASSTSWIRRYGAYGLLVAFTSSGFVQKYAGIAGLAGYAAVVTAIFIALGRVQGGLSRLVLPHLRWVAPLFLVGLAAIHLGLHQVEDGRGTGRSSDRDEGLEIAVTRLFAGQNPYYPAHPQAGPLSVLPGAILLASPFVLLGWVGLQNIFWIGVFLWMLRGRANGRGSPLIILAVTLLVSPSAQYEIVSGGDMIANGAYVACFFMFACDTWNNPASPRSGRILASVLLGTGLASRANFVLLLPLLTSVVWRLSGPRAAMMATLSVGASCLVWVAPFYFLDPAAFTPLKSRDKIMFDGSSLAWADEVILGLTCLTTAALAIRLLRGPSMDVMRRFHSSAAISTATPMVAMVALASFASHGPDFRIMHDRFGLMYLFFALAALVHAPDPDDRSPPGTSGSC
jgi:hypothetical protein